ncbi:hypothetical protein D3C78_1302660 [compost metagenome]
MRSELEGQLVHQTADGALADRVHHSAPIGRIGGRRGRQHHRPLAGLQQVEEYPRGQDVALDVDVEDLVEQRVDALRRHLHDRHIAVEDALRTDHGIEPAVAREDGVMTSPQIVQLGHVALDDQRLGAEFLFELPHLVGRDLEDHHFGAFGHAMPCNAQPQSRPATGHQHYIAFQ